jgi:hypothetical protein
MSAAFIAVAPRLRHMNWVMKPQTFRRTWILPAALVVQMLLQGSARAADTAIPVDREAQLHQVYYDDRVLETCGLYTAESYDGFQREVLYLVTTGGIDAENRKRIEIAGWGDADYQYGNHGMAGFRHWCASDGKKAADGFVAFRRRALADQRR